MKKSYDLTILDQHFTIKSDKDEKEVKKVADYVNKKMHEIVSTKKVVSTSNVALLTALNIAGDFFDQKNQHDLQIRDWADKVKLIIDKMDDK